MEKFSAFRDPGTGIQPFLRPIPPSGSEALASILSPVGYAFGAVKTVLLLGLALVYFVLVEGVCLVFYPVRPLHRAITHLFTAFLSRMALLLVGLYWVPVDVVARKRGRNAPKNESWSPAAGDLIVSNWASWVEILWLAFRFKPAFILPVVDTLDIPSPTEKSVPLSRTPGRRTGTGSAAISSPSRAPMQRIPIRGFRRVGLLRMLASTAHLPLVAGSTSAKPESLEEIRSQSDRPVVVFPEGTTSNGRALLRFADVFGNVKLPVMKYKVFVMCVRYDPPTAFAPTLSHSIPSKFANPIPHVFKLASSLAPLTLSIRLLSPSESPSSGSFLLSEFLTGGTYSDELAECCAALMSQIGRFKRVGLGWEDKAAFLNMYKGKR
ncbi:hypothetical protein DICSQDRAFT_106503 [Dichomitus squalens LYAD-421 SS1]|uniref:Phospholipid/glycerol acyltransferase domain-containing protein n=1 Tax=Dichomitus squalens (strain LYAD-421) TaxID=732165 RepID=R7T280_DICSQ|nr:uncharacterized protein DICSQDRAFT_106503 [Dichomitus squalens LYAD-421 SS1]EJF61307.1 hypothetical protein DICSQDRAFT_106503 [Dichomitus squalens LYAD-421 SS1]